MDLSRKKEIVAEFGLEFDDAVNLFSEETLTSMGLCLINGGSHKEYIGSGNDCTCKNGDNCDCSFNEVADNCKCNGNNCNCSDGHYSTTSPTSTQPSTKPTLAPTIL